MKRILILILALVMLTGAVLLHGCNKKKEDKRLTTGPVGVVRDEEFGNVYVGLSIAEFNALGFAFGDSVDIEFDNGVKLTDIPYYSGYYTPVGELLLCGYPGYPHPVVARNYGDATWNGFAMEEDAKVTVTLNKQGKYIATQELFALEYSDDRSKYESDVAFANFREVKGGSIQPGRFYRSASPCDDQHNRAAYANKLAEEHGIRFVINLSDSSAKYISYTESEGFASEYYDSLYNEGNVLTLALNANYRSVEYAREVTRALYFMTQKDEAPCLVHCVEGKDRTGFVCALILALAGATAQEIVDDYMITYDNYYRITKAEKPEKYEAILPNVYDFFYCMCEAEKGTPLDQLDLKTGAERYLTWGGASDPQIEAIIEFITG